MPMHSDYPTLENMRQNLTHSILQRACHSGFGLSDNGKNTHRTKGSDHVPEHVFSAGIHASGSDDPTW